MIAGVAALALAKAAVHWLGSALIDGTLFALVAWLTSVTLLKRSSGRVLALIWLAVLVKFVLVWPLETHAVQVHVSAERAHATSAALAHARWLPMAYGLIVMLLSVLQLVRQARLRRVITQLAPADAIIVQRVKLAAGALSLQRIPDVRVSDALGPFSVGPWRPTLVLPRWLCVPGARLDAVLLHELAHLARRDHWCLWFERSVATLFFFWPPVHWVTRKLDEARELACDERAIQRGRLSAIDYGRHLLDVVTAARAQRQPLTPGSVLAIGRMPLRLEGRIDRLLEEPWARRTRWTERAACALLMAASLLALRVGFEREAAVAETLMSASQGCGSQLDVYPPPPSAPSCDGTTCSVQPAP